MTDKRTTLDILQEAQGKPSKERRALLLEAIEQADAENDLDLGFSTRRSYIQASHNESNQLMMIAHYGWCLARHDEDPERFPVSLWEYKWVLDAAPRFSGVSRDQLVELGADMARRFDAEGASKGPVGVAACSIAAALGDLDDLAVQLSKWQNTSKSGWLNDCSTCDVASEVYFLMVLGRHQEAIDAGAPVISGGRRCASQPHYAYADLLTCCRAVGDTELGDELSHKGLELIKNDPDFTQAFGNQLRHLAIVNQLDTALEVLKRIAPLAYGDDRSMFDFCRGVRLVLRRADEQGIDVADLHAEFDGKAEQIAAQFDARNDNTYVSDTLTSDDAEYASFGTA